MVADLHLVTVHATVVDFVLQMLLLFVFIAVAVLDATVCLCIF